MTDPDSDPIAAAFKHHARPPRDVVSKASPAADGPPIPTGPGIGYYSNELGDDGVTRESGTAFVRMYQHRKDGDE